MSILSIIVPCYNEEETVELFYNTTEKIRQKLSMEFEYIFVNDGSRDETLIRLRNLAKKILMFGIYHSQEILEKRPLYMQD